MRCDACDGDLSGIVAFPGVEITCPACGARSVAGGAAAARTAAAYRTAPTRASTGEPSASARCPRCRAELVVEGGARQRCPKCSGAFVDHGEVRRLLADADAARTKAPFKRRKKFDPDVRSFDCVVCREPMERNPLGATSGIYLDACEAHGIWFDAGELEDATEYVRAVGLEEARRPPPAPPPPKAPPPHEVAPPGMSAPKVTGVEAVKLRAGLEAQLAYQMLHDQRDMERLAAGTSAVSMRRSANLIDFVFRLVR